MHTPVCSHPVKVVADAVQDILFLFLEFQSRVAQFPVPYNNIAVVLLVVASLGSGTGGQLIR